MSAGRAVLVLVVATGISFLLAVTLGETLPSAAQESEEPAGGEASIGVAWDFRPDDLGELTEESKAVVVAEVESIRQGEPMVASSASAEDPIVIPTELVELRVAELIEGELPERFTLYKLGQGDLQPSGDPAYAVGERYLLFVRRRLEDDLDSPHPDGTYIAVAPDGRLEQEPSGELSSLIDGEVANELDGLTISQAEDAVAAASP